MIYGLLILLFNVILLCFFTTQIIVPILTGTPLFWLFRKSRRNISKIEKDITNIKDKLTEKELNEFKKQLEESLKE